MSKDWSNLAKVVYRRTYSRKDSGFNETWQDTVNRVVEGNSKTVQVSEEEKAQLKQIMLARKGSPAGRGIWYSGAPSHAKLGGAALNNCWFLTSDDWNNFIIAQDLLMLGGGVGLSVEHKFSSKLPKVKKNVVISHKPTKDAEFIVPDSREGWNELTRRVLEAFFVTGKGFTYSTVCVRSEGEPINGFGGTASGPRPLIAFIEKVCALLTTRQGKSVRPIDAADIICATGEMVVAGNVRRSAIIILGDPWDKEYLKAKRWDLGQIPTHRAMANFSVVTSDIDDLHPLFWKTYEHGEPYGIVNRENMKKYGRMGELKADTAEGTNPCAEATLENGEPCNLLEIPLTNVESADEFETIARLLFRYGKRVTCEKYHHQLSDEVVKRNRRIGIGITGCLSSPLFKPEILDRVYNAIQDEDKRYSKELGVPESIRTTVIKPSGTLSKIFDCNGEEGIHAAYSEYGIQRVRFSSTDPLIPHLKAAGHHVEPIVRFDGTLDHTTLVVDFYVKAPDGAPIAGKTWDTWQQLEAVKMAQKHWADQSISVTVYYKKEEIPKLKEWLSKNLSEIKTVSFLCQSEHGFKQAPKEEITKEQYEAGMKSITPIDIDSIFGDGFMEGMDCENGACPIK